MPIGQRAASVPIQIVALLVGIVGGMLLGYAVVMPLVIVLVTSLRLQIALSAATIDLFVRFLCVVFCAHFLAAPTTWRGLSRRALLVLAVSLLGFAALGYLFAFAGFEMGGLPDYEPIFQFLVVVLGAAAAVGFSALRDPAVALGDGSATVPAAEGAQTGPSADAASLEDASSAPRGHG